MPPVIDTKDSTVVSQSIDAIAVSPQTQRWIYCRSSLIWKRQAGVKDSIRPARLNEGDHIFPKTGLSPRRPYVWVKSNVSIAVVTG